MLAKPEPLHHRNQTDHHQCGCKVWMLRKQRLLYSAYFKNISVWSSVRFQFNCHHLLSWLQTLFAAYKRTLHLMQIPIKAWYVCIQQTTNPQEKDWSFVTKQLQLSHQAALVGESHYIWMHLHIHKLSAARQPGPVELDRKLHPLKIQHHTQEEVEAFCFSFRAFNRSLKDREDVTHHLIKRTLVYLPNRDSWQHRKWRYL